MGAIDIHPDVLPALWRLVRRSPRIAVASVLGAALLGLLWLSSRPAPSGGATGSGAGSGGSRLLTPEVELRGVVRQLQEDTALLRKSLEDVYASAAGDEGPQASGPDGALSAREIDACGGSSARCRRLRRPPSRPCPAASTGARGRAAARRHRAARITVFTVGRPGPAATPRPITGFISRPAAS